MELLLQQVLAGLATGAIYASMALAVVMIYQAIDHLNFAQGEMAMFSTYIAWSLIESGLPYWGAFAATVIISFVMGVAIERAIIRPIGSRSELAVVVVFIALLVIFNSVAGWIWTYSLKTFPTPFSTAVIPSSKYLSTHEIGAMLITLVELAALYGFFRYTSLGLAMRAAALNPVSSRLVGIKVGWMLALGWGLAAVLGAVAGMMVAHVVYLDPNMMAGILLYGFAGRCSAASTIRAVPLSAASSSASWKMCSAPM
jgi:branched-chain amino acid transport system permease protein